MEINIKKILKEKPGYAKWGNNRLAKLFKVPIKDVIQAKEELKFQHDNILIIGDTHFPFEHPDYLTFCNHVRNKHKCTKIIHIGDVIDNHYSSFHPTDPDGYGAKEELDRAIDKLKAWYAIFPEVTVTIGNHDALITRKLYDSGLSNRWMRSLNEVLEIPNWKFVESFIYNNIMFQHGTGSSGNLAAYNRALYNNISTVQGHLHSFASIQYVNNNIFGMQVGCGVDSRKYAFNYAKYNTKQFIVSCGVIVQGTPIIETL